MTPGSSSADVSPDDLRRTIVAALGPLLDPPPLDLVVEGEERADGYRRLRIAYSGPAGRIPAYLCLPDGDAPAPLVYCHHQHNGRFDLGKSEVVGLAGDPDQAYAAQLARRGFATLAPDAIGFEERNWAGGGQNVTWFELATRIVAGRTLLADCLQEVSIGLDAASAFAEVDASPIGFLGHSYGGRTAMWAPMWDRRIRASVSNAGCVPYRDSIDRAVGLQAEFVVPGVLGRFDVEDVLAAGAPADILVIAREEDRWSLGAAAIRDELARRGADHVRVEIEPGGHVFPAETRERAYRFLAERLGAAGNTSP